MVGDGVGVLEPPQLAVGHHHVRVGVQAQERRDLLDPVLDEAPVLDLALRRNCPADEDVDVGELPRVREAPQQGAEVHAAPAVVDVVGGHGGLGVDGRKVELRLLRVDDDVVRAVLAVVDLGHVHVRHEALERLAAGLGRDVLDEELRLAVLGELGRGAHGHPEAVGILETPVHPRLRLRRQVLREQLARAEHNLPDLAVYLVAVNVHTDKAVVRAKELNLIVYTSQRPADPTGARSRWCPGLPPPSPR